MATYEEGLDCDKTVKSMQAICKECKFKRMSELVNYASEHGLEDWVHVLARRGSIYRRMTKTLERDE